MKIHVLIYDQFANFEVMLVGWMKANQHEMITVSLNQDFVTSVEGFKVMADQKLKDVDTKDVELLLIPGGNTPTILGNAYLKQFIKSVNAQGAVIGAICFAPVLLGEADILENKQFTTSVGTDDESFTLFKNGHFTNEDVVVDGNIITAKGNAYVEFALEVCKHMELVKPDHLTFYKSFLKNTKEEQVVS